MKHLLLSAIAVLAVNEFRRRAWRGDHLDRARRHQGGGDSR